MDHMRISGTEPSSAILSQTELFKQLKIDAQKVPKQAKAKRDGVINPKIRVLLDGEYCRRSECKNKINIVSKICWVNGTENKVQVATFISASFNRTCQA